MHFSPIYFEEFDRICPLHNQSEANLSRVFAQFGRISFQQQYFSNIVDYLSKMFKNFWILNEIYDNKNIILTLVALLFENMYKFSG